MIRIARRILDELSRDRIDPKRAEQVCRDSVQLARLVDGERKIELRLVRDSEVPPPSQRLADELALEEVRVLAEGTLEDPLADPNFDVDCVVREMKYLSDAVLDATKSGLSNTALLAAPAVLLAQFVTYLDASLTAGVEPGSRKRSGSGSGPTSG